MPYQLEYYYEVSNVNMPQLQKQVDIAGHFAGLNFKQVPAVIRQPIGMKLNKGIIMKFRMLSIFSCYF